MATKFNFAGKTIREAGAYSATQSGISNAPLETTYGNVLIIDKGLGATWGGGAGIAGTFSQGIDSINEFVDIEEMRESLMGGMFWLLAKPLFRPSKDNTVPGVSKVFYIKAAETVAAKIAYTFGDAINGSTLEVGVKNEGVAGNGVLTNGELTKGYAARIRRAVAGQTIFAIDFYVGTFKGLDAAGEAYDFVPATSTKAKKIVTTPNFTNLKELTEWFATDKDFNDNFSLVTLTTIGTGNLVEADLTNNVGYKLATGGTENYTAAALDQVIEAVADLDYSFVLADDYAANAQSTGNTTVQSHIETGTKLAKFMVVGGGDDRNKLEGVGSSIETSKYYDSNKVIVVHAGVKKNRPTGGHKEYPSIYKAALVLGRIAGLPPQVPVTWKDLDMDADRHNMSVKEREKALDAGVLHTKLIGGEWMINEGINSMQKNSRVLNADGKSHLISVERIFADLNKGLVSSAEEELLKQRNGVNRNTLSELDFKLWGIGYLNRRVAQPSQDNLITYFDNVTVKTVGNSMTMTYRAEPNFEVSRLFTLGTMIDRSSN